MHVAVVGGGISGLSAAFYIKRLRPEARVTLLEQAPRLGGTMRTDEVDGFLFEAGSNGFLTNKPHTLDLVRDAGAEPLLMRSNDAARIRYIYTDALHRLPEDPLRFVATPLLSMGGKLRVLAEIVTPARRDEGDESLRDFGYRRVGRQFTDVFLDAMCAGIYASTPDRISVSAAFPLVVRLEREHGGLFRGMLKKRKSKAGPGGVLMSFVRGVSTFIDHLGRAIESEVRLGTEVTGLARDGEGWRLSFPGGDLAADRVVLAGPAYTSARLLAPLDAEIARRLERIEYSPIAVVGLGYRQLAHPLAGFGLLTTTSARKPILGVLWDSSIFPDRAPPGQKCVRVMIGGQRNPDLAARDDDELVALARQGVAETMGVRDEPTATFVQHWERGIPNYPVGHLANVDAVFERLRAHRGLYLTSNAYYGIGLNDCVAQARSCAEQVAHDAA
jgi:oxygen-dependent protoporphyrinogen oxidase